MTLIAKRLRDVIMAKKGASSLIFLRPFSNFISKQRAYVSTSSRLSQ